MVSAIADIVDTSKETAGYTLVESVVALGLMVSVLIPATVILGNMLTDRATVDMLEAQTSAQQLMEVTLNERDLADSEEWAYRRRIRLRKEIHVDEGLATITVTAYRQETDIELFRLVTSRLL